MWAAELLGIPSEFSNEGDSGAQERHNAGRVRREKKKKTKKSKAVI